MIKKINREVKERECGIQNLCCIGCILCPKWRQNPTELYGRILCWKTKENFTILFFRLLQCQIFIQTPVFNDHWSIFGIAVRYLVLVDTPPHFSLENWNLWDIYLARNVHKYVRISCGSTRIRDRMRHWESFEKTTKIILSFDLFGTISRTVLNEFAKIKFSLESEIWIQHWKRLVLVLLLLSSKIVENIRLYLFYFFINKEEMWARGGGETGRWVGNWPKFFKLHTDVRV